MPRTYRPRGWLRLRLAVGGRFDVGMATAADEFASEVSVLAFEGADDVS